MNKKATLPPMVTKKQLVNYFQYSSSKYLYRWVITEAIVEEAGFKMEEIKSQSCKKLPPALTHLIYQKHKIESL